MMRIMITEIAEGMVVLNGDITVNMEVVVLKTTDMTKIIEVRIKDLIEIKVKDLVVDILKKVATIIIVFLMKNIINAEDLAAWVAINMKMKWVIVNIPENPIQMVTEDRLQMVIVEENMETNVM